MLYNEKKVGMENASGIISAKFDGFGTEIELRIVTGDSLEVRLAKKNITEVRAMAKHFTEIFSRFDRDSELSKLNCNLGIFNEVSAEMLEVANICLKFNGKTDGIFEPRIVDTLENIGYKDDFKKGNFFHNKIEQEIDRSSSLSDDLKIKGSRVLFGVRMDFSGIVKGLVADKIAQFLLKNGWKNFLVDLGGDMYLGGGDQHSTTWLIDVEGVPHEKLMLALCNKGVATSGISRRKWEIDGRRFHHLINPGKREQFLFDLRTVTVVAENTEEADAWAKTLFLMGRVAGYAYAKENSIAAIFLDYKGGVWISPMVKNSLY